MIVATTSPSTNVKTGMNQFQYLKEEKKERKKNIQQRFMHTAQVPQQMLLHIALNYRERKFGIVVFFVFLEHNISTFCSY